MEFKYSKLSQSDPDNSRDKDSTVLDFNSIFTYDYPKHFSYGGQSKKYRSAFTYPGGVDPNSEQPIMNYEKPSKAMTIFAGTITVLCYICLVLTFPISWWFCHKKIPQYERLVVFRIGRLLSTKGPGNVLILPCIDRHTRIDLRLKAFSVPPQIIMTSDGGSIELGAEVHHHVKDPVLVVNNIQDLNHSLRVIAQTSMQKLLNKYCISDVETGRAAISQSLLDELNHVSLKWGVECTKVEMSAVKVLMQPNPALSSQPDPLHVLSQVFFPQGGSGGGQPAMPGLGGTMMEQLASHFQFGGATPQKTDQSISDLMQMSSETMENKPEKPVKKPKKKFQNAFDLLDAVQPHLNSSLVQQFKTVYKFVVTGSEGGTFYLDLKNGTGSASKGDPPIGQPDVTLTLSCDTLRRLLTEQTTPFGAYMSGSLEMDGDTNTASRLSELIEIVNK